MQHIFCSYSHSHNLIFVVPPGTRYCRVDKEGVDAQGFYTWPALQESNPGLTDVGSNALTTPPHAPTKMNGILGYDLVLERLQWAGDNLG